MRVGRCGIALFFVVTWTLLAPASAATGSTGNEIDDQVWSVVSETVAAGDIDGMAAVYHADAVLVSGKGTVAVAEQLVRWGEGMAQAARDGTSATVAFRFTSRQDDVQTAFERGIFRYAETDSEGVEEPVFVPFEALLVRQDGSWVILMERQFEATDEDAWTELER